MARASLLALILAVLTLALALRLGYAGASPQSLPPEVPHPAPARRLPPAAPDGPLTARQESSHTDSYCLTCHDDPTLQTQFADGRTLSLHVDAAALRDSAHGLVTCLTCHEDHEARPPDRVAPPEYAAYWAEATQMCLRCHLASAGGYAGSAHGRPVLSGAGEGATCVDCHAPEPSAHATGWAGDERLRLAPATVEVSCGRCHEEALRSYRDSSHTALTRLSEPDSLATCTTCHGDHAVTAVNDPERPLSAATLVPVCGSCHDGADEAFARGWLGHDTSSARSDVLHYLGRGIVLVMALGLSFGLAHMALDVVRPLADRSRRGGGRED